MLIELHVEKTNVIHNQLRFHRQAGGKKYDQRLSLWFISGTVG